METGFYIKNVRYQVSFLNILTAELTSLTGVCFMLCIHITQIYIISIINYVVLCRRALC